MYVAAVLAICLMVLSVVIYTVTGSEIISIICLLISLVGVIVGVIADLLDL